MLFSGRTLCGRSSALASLAVIVGVTACSAKGADDQGPTPPQPQPTTQNTGGGMAPPPVPTNTGAPTPGVIRDTSIAFSWPEADLNAGPGTCKGGLYEGAFDGMYASPVTFIGIGVPVTGNVRLTLVEAMSGEFFEITNGTVEGFANFTIPYRADLEGRLNCATKKMEAGFLRNGSYEVTPGVPNFFEGPVTADYDGAASAFVNGTWTVGEPVWIPPPQPPSQFGGAGMWGAAWVGP